MEKRAGVEVSALLSNAIEIKVSVRLSEEVNVTTGTFKLNYSFHRSDMNYLNITCGILILFCTLSSPSLPVTSSG